MAANQTLLPAYLAVGNDNHKQERTIKRFRSHLSEATATFDLDELRITKSPDVDWAGRILGSLEQLPFGSPTRLVIVRDADLMDSATQKALVAYLKDPNPRASLLLVADHLNANSALSKAIKALGKGAVISCSAPKRRNDAIADIEARARNHRIWLEPGAAQEIYARLGANAGLIEQSLETLAALAADEGSVGVELVRQQVAAIEQPKPWDLTDALGSRDVARALSLLGRFDMSDTSAAIGQHAYVVQWLRELLTVRSLIDAGRRGDIQATLGRMDEARGRKARKREGWMMTKLERQAMGFGEQELVRALRESLDVELELKGSGDDLAALARWYMGICGAVARP